MPTVLFKPGHSGNPTGRPSGAKGLAAALRRFGGKTIDEVCEIECDEERSVFDRSAARMIAGLYWVGKEAFSSAYNPIIGDDGKLLSDPDWRLFMEFFRVTSDRVDGSPRPAEQLDDGRVVSQSITLKGSALPEPALEKPKEIENGNGQA